MKRKWCFVFTHRHLCRHTIHIFLTASVLAFVMPCAPRTCLIIFYSLRGDGQTLTSHLVLARSWPAFIPCGGSKEAGHAQLFVRAFIRARLPRTPTRLARARVGLTVIYVVGKFIMTDHVQNAKYK
jgi:hypothetical protein